MEACSVTFLIVTRLICINQLKNNNMELVFTVQDLEPEPKVLKEQVKPEGLLNSNYKNIVNKNFKNTTSQSLFGMRQRLKRCQYQFTSSIETVLKVSTFAVIFIAIFS